MRRRKSETQLKVIQLWYSWLRGLPIPEIASSMGTTSAQVARQLSQALKEATVNIGDMPLEFLRAEKIVAQLELIERHLWLLYAREERRYTEALQELEDAATDEERKTALLLTQQHLQNCKSLLAQIKDVVNRKAEIMRRIGMVPTAVERTAHAVLMAQPGNQPLPSLDDLEARQPLRAPIVLELPEAQSQDKVSEND